MTSPSSPRTNRRRSRAGPGNVQRGVRGITLQLAEVDLDRLTIVLYPDPVLRKKCETVEVFTPQLHALARRMLELMKQAPGVGLAASQVGIPIRMFVCNPTADPADDQVYVNPVLTDLEGSFEADEGCLSLPQVTVPVRRAQSVTLSAHDPAGQPIVRTGQDLTARVWQHETDHLDGRLIIDAMPTSVELANRRILKELKDKYRTHKRRPAVP